jgi:ABC-type uncharacterized transport system ATPase subunit
MRGIVLLVTAVALAWHHATFAADPRYPDWPCRQIKVPELSIAAVWAGPAVDDVGDAWQNEPQINDLISRLAARRTSLEEAEKAITDFLATDPAGKQTKAKLLFAGLFATLDRERSVVMSGIERFSHRQKQFAEKIRSEAGQLRTLQDAPEHDQAKLDELINTINWDTRIFEEQRKTISYVCDVPTLIEQRLFALARTIQQSID